MTPGRGGIARRPGVSNGAGAWAARRTGGPARSTACGRYSIDPIAWEPLRWPVTAVCRRRPRVLNRQPTQKEVRLARRFFSPRPEGPPLGRDLTGFRRRLVTRAASASRSSAPGTPSALTWWQRVCHAPRRGGATRSPARTGLGIRGAGSRGVPRPRRETAASPHPAEREEEHHLPKRRYPVLHRLELRGLSRCSGSVSRAARAFAPRAMGVPGIQLHYLCRLVIISPMGG